MILTQTRYASLNQNVKKNSEADSSIYSKDSFNYNSDEQNLENNISSFSEINDSRDDLNNISKKSSDIIQMKKLTDSNAKSNDEGLNLIGKTIMNEQTSNLDFMCNDTSKENIDVSSYVDCYSSMLLEIDNDFDKITQNNDQLNEEGSFQTPLNTQASDSTSTLSGIQKKFIVKIVTVFAVIFFLLCFAMVAFTLRMSEKIDEQIRESNNKLNAISNSSRLTLNIMQQKSKSSYIKNRADTSNINNNNYNNESNSMLSDQVKRVSRK